ncbi:MAG: hypothetical protein QM790_11230 [Nibricoccus sp.]
MKTSLVRRRCFGPIHASQFPATLLVGRSLPLGGVPRLPGWCLAVVGIILLGWLDAAHASAATLAADGRNTVFIKADGTVWRVGNVLAGQPGHGTPVQVNGIVDPTAMASGGDYQAFIKKDGTLWTVGSNGYGQLGDGTTTTRSTPVQVIGGTSISAVAIGGGHTIFLKTDGTLWAMGLNDAGQLGDGTTTNRSAPVQVSGGTNVTAVAAGAYHTVFLKADGTVWATGSNYLNQLGDGTTTNRSTPVQVSGGTDATSVSAGANHTLFIKSDGTLWAVGSNSFCELGDGTSVSRSTPVQVVGGTNVAAASGGRSHTVFLKKDGTLWAAGFNSAGELGDGTTSTRATAVQVIGGTNVIAAAAGGSHTVFLKPDGTIWAMGSNYYGQLSNSTYTIGGVSTPTLLNQSIVLTRVGDKAVSSGSSLNFTITATDLENNPLTFSASGLPPSATFNPSTRTFTWNPVNKLSDYFYVTFTVTGGLSQASETIHITVTDTNAPSIPTGLSGSASSATAILLTWTPSTDDVSVVRYNVYRNGVQVGTSSTASYSDTGLQSGTAYNYTVSATDTSNNTSAQSGSISVKTSITGVQTRNVTNMSTLTSALAEAAANPAATFTINMAGGTYALGSTPLPNLSSAGVTLQSPLTPPYAIIDAAGFSGDAVFDVAASNVTISGVTFKNVANRAITIQPGANSGSILGCSFYGASAHAAIFGRGCSNWMVLVNEFYDIAGTTSTAEPAVYFCEGSTNLAVANNLFQDCDRGIGFGTGARENNGSVWLFNNMISDTRTASYAGPSISVAYVTSGAARIENNTVYQLSSYANAIEYNNNTATITVRNNLTNKPLRATNSPSVVFATNNASAVAAWFKDANDGDLRLASAIAGVVDVGTMISDLTIDIEADARPSGAGWDIGADEYIQTTTPGGGGNPPANPSTPASSGGGGGGGAPSYWFVCALPLLALARRVFSRKCSACKG